MCNSFLGVPPAADGANRSLVVAGIDTSAEQC